MSFIESIQVILFIGSAAFMAIIILIIVRRSKMPQLPVIKRHKEETEFLDPILISNVPFPNIEDEPSLDLSVIVPAYNEEDRLPQMLNECLEFLEKRSKIHEFTYEVIIVSDGSSDKTVSVALQYSKQYTTAKVRVLELIENRGKGGAVRLGVLSARGRDLLFVDADGATKFSDYTKLNDVLKTLVGNWRQDALIVGSRARLEQESKATRSFFRNFLMYGFHFLVWLFAVRSVRDTQCGFKLMTRSTARKLFTNLHVERWAFDVELIYIAECLQIPLREVAVEWHEIDGSKLTPVWSWLQMVKDLFLIWFWYTTGAWQINVKLHSE